MPLTWNRTRFESTRVKCRHARKLIEISINVQCEKKLRYLYTQNLDLEKTITETNEHLRKHEKKVHIFDSLTEIAKETLPTFFDQRMEKLRSIMQENFNAIEKAVDEEKQYWKEIHSAIDQNLITSDDIHSHKQTISTVDQDENSMENDKSPFNTNVDHRVSTKKESFSAAINSVISNRLIPCINKTYHIKLQDITNNETSRTLLVENSSQISTTSTDASPMYSQPQPPAPLFFSPTLLQDEQFVSTKNFPSPIDQNVIPKVILNRVSQELLHNYLRITDINCIDSNTFFDQSKSTDAIKSELNSYQQNSFVFPKSISNIRSHPTMKKELKSESITNDRKQTRKRKQSASKQNNATLSNITLRKRKPFSFAEMDETEPKSKIKHIRKNNQAKQNEQPIREPSPVPIIDLSTHPSACLSTHCHRSNICTPSLSDVENIDDNEKTINRFQRLKTRTKKKSNQLKNN